MSSRAKSKSKGKKKSKDSRVGKDGQSTIRWRKGEVLGRGAFATVYKGLDVDTGRIMAVKEVQIKNAKVDTVIREVQLLSALDHPNIVKYLGTQIPDNHTLHIFLEFVPGGSIESLLSKFETFGETLTRVYVKQILSGLVYLHESNILHRDIKGGNILVTNDGVAKLTDFGASRDIGDLARGDDGQSMSLHGTVTGTPLWMAPEVVQEYGYGRKADVYSLGATVMEMLTGHPPNSHIKNFAALVRFWDSGGSVEIPKSISPLARDFLKKALATDPNDRPTAAELLEHPWVSETEAFVNLDLDSQIDGMSTTVAFSKDDADKKPARKLATTLGANTNLESSGSYYSSSYSSSGSGSSSSGSDSGSASASDSTALPPPTAKVTAPPKQGGGGGGSGARVPAIGIDRASVSSDDESRRGGLKPRVTDMEASNIDKLGATTLQLDDGGKSPRGEKFIPPLLSLPDARVIVADEDDDRLKQTIDVLFHLGAESVQGIKNSAEAVKRIGAGGFDVLVVSTSFPTVKDRGWALSFSGLDVALYMRSESPDRMTARLVFTGDGNAEIPEMLKGEVRAESIIPAPVTEALMADALGMDFAPAQSPGPNEATTTALSLSTGEGNWDDDELASLRVVVADVEADTGPQLRDALVELGVRSVSLADSVEAAQTQLAPTQSVDVVFVRSSFPPLGDQLFAMSTFVELALKIRIEWQVNARLFVVGETEEIADSMLDTMQLEAVLPVPFSVDDVEDCLLGDDGIGDEMDG